MDVSVRSQGKAGSGSGVSYYELRTKRGSQACFSEWGRGEEFEEDVVRFDADQRACATDISLM